MHPVDYMAVSEKVIEQVPKGAFLTVQAGDNLNVMTIGWASLGLLWAKPMMTVMVRKSRYTFELIERSSEFTVSVPMLDVSEKLAFCGTESGRDHDKFKECQLDIIPGQKVHTPVIDIPAIHFECNIVCKSPVDPDLLIERYKHLYPAKDYHTLYFGEIAYCYSTVDKKG